MNNRKKLITAYLSLGGKQSFIDTLPPFFSLDIEAKLRLEIRRLQQRSSHEESPASIDLPAEADHQAQTVPVAQKLPTLGLLSDYPEELHQIYTERLISFTEACSLKIQLNELKEEETEKAYALQLSIVKKMDVVEEYAEVLTYYRNTKKVLPIFSKEAIAHLNTAELIQKRNTLRSNVSCRKKTLQKMHSIPNPNTKQKEKITQKMAELESLKLLIERIDCIVNERE